jgi:predicted dehydrogenase
MVGFGTVAMHGHLPGWLERRDVEIVAATDVRPAQRALCDERLPHARWHESIDALLDADALDFVDVCTPPSSHAAVVRAALERGLHVLCEKPLVRSIDELPPIVEVARASGRVLHTVHNWHHAPIVRRVDELVRGGAIGTPTRVVWHTLRTQPAVAGDGQSANWRLDPAVAGGGVLSDHGWHVCYVIPRWLARWPTAVRATLETRRHHESPVEDTATVALAFPGATAEIFLTWAADARRNWARIEGAGGHIELHDDALRLHTPHGEREWACPPLSGGSHHPDWFGAVAEEFVGAIAGGPRGSNLAEATLCASIEALARESSGRGGVTLSVPPAASTAPRPAGAGAF